MHSSPLYIVTPLIPVENRNTERSFSHQASLVLIIFLQNLYSLPTWKPKPRVYYVPGAMLSLKGKAEAWPQTPRWGRFPC